mmetsp:Transcript_128748/g.412451  ORF Transcript_128748/g.412451 Transcript_128748/m.412451 type:complete len:385 (-) Transcript_128748:58-1212(-)
MMRHCWPCSRRASSLLPTVSVARTTIASNTVADEPGWKAAAGPNAAMPGLATTTSASGAACLRCCARRRSSAAAAAAFMATRRRSSSRASSSSACLRRRSASSRAAAAHLSARSDPVSSIAREKPPLRALRLGRPRGGASRVGGRLANVSSDSDSCPPPAGPRGFSRAEGRLAWELSGRGWAGPRILPAASRLSSGSSSTRTHSSPSLQSNRMPPTSKVAEWRCPPKFIEIPLEASRVRAVLSPSSQKMQEPRIVCTSEPLAMAQEPPKRSEGESTEKGNQSSPKSETRHLAVESAWSTATTKAVCPAAASHCLTSSALQAKPASAHCARICEGSAETKSTSPGQTCEMVASKDDGSSRLCCPSSLSNSSNKSWKEASANKVSS